MKALIPLLTLIFFSTTSNSPIPVELDPSGITRVEGDLSQGQPMDDLAWAWDSANACFPATQQHKFNGHHVLYSTELPRYSEMEVKVTPADTTQNFSIYAYEVGMNSDAIVPNLPNCVRCEVDHKWDRPWRGKTQDHTRTAKNLLALNNPYKIVVGVVGAEGLAEGAYTLEFSVKSR